MPAITLPDRSWLDAPATRALANALAAGGIDFRFVGGAVRDSLLGRPVADIDLATPARPEGVIEAIRAAGLKAIPTGISHGTVTAVSGGRPFEITTLRRDVETDGRRAVVAFTDDWREDAARRDFTMNALYADREGRVTDFFGGAEDAHAGHVRFIGDPARRIEEDGLRILRFFRFHAWYGRGAPDAAGLAACASHARIVDRLSGERVRTELFKLLSSPDPGPASRTMEDAGVLAHALPVASRIGDLERLVAAESVLGLNPDPVRRLAAVTGPLTPDGVTALKARLRLANRDEDRLTFFDAATDRVALVVESSFTRALYEAEPQLVLDAALLACARFGRPDSATLGALIRFIPTWRPPRFPLKAADLLARGLPPGPAVGDLLARVKAWWIAGNFTADRAECLAELGRLLT